MIRFEGYERRIDKINAVMAEYGFASSGEAISKVLSSRFFRAMANMLS